MLILESTGADHAPDHGSNSMKATDISVIGGGGSATDDESAPRAAHVSAQNATLESPGAPEMHSNEAAEKPPSPKNGERTSSSFIATSSSSTIETSTAIMTNSRGVAHAPQVDQLHHGETQLRQAPGAVLQSGAPAVSPSLSRTLYSIGTPAAPRLRRLSQFKSQPLPPSQPQLPCAPQCIQLSRPYPLTPSFHKRLLPDTCIALNSREGKRLFQIALDDNKYMESYFSLSMQFLTQAEPAFCGLASLCMVLNALEIDPLTIWRDPWRWYDETMLECCRTLEDIKNSGISLPEFLCLAQCNSLNAHMVRGEECTKQQFIDDIRRACCSDTEFMVVSYHRGTLQQTGDGHFSPIGGYNEAENMVLVLDVARFKYPAYWVSADLLWEALMPKDRATERSRGYVLLSRGARRYIKSLISQLSVTSESWSLLAQALFKTLPSKLSSMPPQSTVQDVVSLMISCIPEEYDSVVENRLSLFLPLVLGSRGSGTLNENRSNAASPHCQSRGMAEPAFNPRDPASIQAAEEALAGSLPTDGANIVKKYIEGLDELLKDIGSTMLYAEVAAAMMARNALRSLEDLRLGDPETTPTQPRSSRASVSRPPPPDSSSHGSPTTPLPHAVSWLSSNACSRTSLASSVVSSRVSHTSRASFAAIMPITHDVDDFCAFLTLFLLAVCSYRPLHEHLPPGVLADQMRAMVDPAQLRMSDRVYNEVEILCNQIAALTELAARN